MRDKRLTQLSDPLCLYEMECKSLQLRPKSSQSVAEDILYLIAVLAKNTMEMKSWGDLKGVMEGDYAPLRVLKNFQLWQGDSESKEFNAEIIWENIVDQNISDYMHNLIEENKDAYRKYLSQCTESNMTPD